MVCADGDNLLGKSVSLPSMWRNKEAVLDTSKKSVLEINVVRCRVIICSFHAIRMQDKMIT